MTNATPTIRVIFLDGKLSQLSFGVTLSLKSIYYTLYFAFSANFLV